MQRILAMEFREVPNSFPLTQKMSSTPRSLAFEKHSLTNSSIGSTKFPNKFAQSHGSKIRGIKVVPKVSNSTTRSTIGVDLSKMFK